MTYCINPKCKHHYNPDNLERCQVCGTVLLIEGRYQLLKPLRKIGYRNHTDIFEVTDGENLKVMKILNGDNPQLIELLEREASALQYLKHPGIPKVELDGYFNFLPNNSKHELHCLVMEKIEGQNLETWIKQNGSILQKTSLNWLKQLLKILEYLHNNGILHRDIKPSNIMLKPDGQLVLIDFGSIREITNTYMAKIAGGLELTSIVSGGYTALEQFNGKALPQSDFFALGRTFVYLLTGQEPSVLPETSTGKLIWHKKAPQISKTFAEFLDELMAPLARERPKNTAEVLPYLNSNGLLIKSVFRFLNSSKLKLAARILLILSMVIILSFPWTKNLLANYYFSQAIKHLQAEQLYDARNNFEKSIKLNQNDAIVRNNLGLLCNALKDFGCAENQFKEALKLTKDNEVIAFIHYNLGDNNQDKKDIESAIKEYENAMYYPGQVGIDATNKYARLQILHKSRNKSLKSTIQKLLETLNKQTKDTKQKEYTDTDNEYYINLSNLYRNLGWAYLQEGQLDKAEKYLTNAIKVDNKINDFRAAPHCLLAQVLQEKFPQEKEGIRDSWEKCLKGQVGNLPEVNTWQLQAHRYINNNK